MFRPCCWICIKFSFFVRQNIFHLCIFKETFHPISSMCFSSIFTHLAYGIIGSGFLLLVVFHVSWMRNINLIHWIFERIQRCLQIWCQYGNGSLCGSICMKIGNSKNMIYVRCAWMCFVHSNCLFRFSIKQYFYLQSVYFFSVENFDFVMQSNKKNWNEYIEQSIKHFGINWKMFELNEIYMVRLHLFNDKNLIRTYFI